MVACLFRSTSRLRHHQPSAISHGGFRGSNGWAGGGGLATAPTAAAAASARKDRRCVAARGGCAAGARGGVAGPAVRHHQDAVLRTELAVRGVEVGAAHETPGTGVHGGVFCTVSIDAVAEVCGVVWRFRVFAFHVRAHALTLQTKWPPLSGRVHTTNDG